VLAQASGVTGWTAALMRLLAGAWYGPGTWFTHRSRYMVYTSIRLGDLMGGLDALG